MGPNDPPALLSAGSTSSGRRFATPPLQAVRRILDDPDRKPVARLVAEVLLLAARQRELPTHYAASLLYRRDSGPIMDYATDREVRRINREVLLPAGRPTLLLHDKAWFDRWLRKHDLPRVPVLAVLDGGVLSRADAPPVTGTDIRAVLGDLFRSAPGGSLFVKPVRGLQGRDCRRLHDVEDLDAWLEDGITQPMCVQPFIRQHPLLDAVYPRAVNTVRVQTCRLGPGPDGRIEAGTGVLRVGARGSVVDNAAQGGLYAGLDLTTGRLLTPFLESFSAGGRAYRNHPDTGVAVADIVVPGVVDAVALLCEGHRWLPNHVVAWDVAVTTQTPVIIEANDFPPLHGVQAAARGLWRHDVYRRVFGAQRRPGPRFRGRVDQRTSR